MTRLETGIRVLAGFNPRSHQHACMHACRELASLTSDHPEKGQQGHANMIEVGLSGNILAKPDGTPQVHANHRVDEEEEAQHADNVAECCVHKQGKVMRGLSAAG